MDRSTALARLRANAEAGKPIIGAGAGTGLSAKAAEAGGEALLIIYNSGRYRMAGRATHAGQRRILRRLLDGTPAHREGDRRPGRRVRRPAALRPPTGTSERNPARSSEAATAPVLGGGDGRRHRLRECPTAAKALSQLAFLAVSLAIPAGQSGRESIRIPLGVPNSRR